MNRSPIRASIHTNVMCRRYRMKNIITADNPIIVTDTMISMESNPMVVFLSSKSLTSRYTYKLDLKKISNLLGYPDPYTCPWGALRFQHTQAIRTTLTELISSRTKRPLSFVTINRQLSALRGILKTSWRLEEMNAEDYYRAIDIENVKGEVLPSGRELTDKEITKLMNVCAEDLRVGGVRDAAIIALTYSCGLRRNEITSINLSDYDAPNERLTVRGKRNKERIAYLVNEAALAVEDWLKIRGNFEGALFLSFKSRSCELTRRRMSGQAIYVMLIKRGRQAGIKFFSPHDLRRTFVSRLLESGVDISTVSKMAGHASVTTTAKYDKRPEAVKYEAAKLLHVSYKRRKQTR